MKRTTLALEDQVLRQLKERAAREGRTLQDLANDLLRQNLAVSRMKCVYRLRLKGWKAKLQPGADILDRDKLLDLMEER